jgi:hypothetical protein
MIGGVGRHGRTRRDAANLSAHLLREPGAVVRIANSVAPDLPSALDDMLLARDGSRASSAFLHVHLSPDLEMSEQQLRQACMIVLSHFGAQDHPAIFVMHEKERKGGSGFRHCHLVVGRVGPDGAVLPSGFEKIRLETAVRIAEFELGERPVLGRHHASAMRWLRQHGRDDVADWLEAAHGLDPAKPAGMASPDKRQAIERQGVKLGAARHAVKTAWLASDTPRAFAAAMTAAGFAVEPGNKAGVWIVKQGDVDVGSLDRILRIKRRDVAAWLSPLAPPTPEQKPAARSSRLSKTRIKRQTERGTLAKVDLDEIRWIAEEVGRKLSSWLLSAASKESERDRLRRQTRAGMTALSTKGASRKPLHAKERAPAGYDTSAETSDLGFRR